MRWLNILPLFLSFVADASPLHRRQETSSTVSVPEFTLVPASTIASSASVAISSAIEPGASSFASSSIVESGNSSISASNGTIPSPSSNVTQAVPAVTIYPDTSSGQPIEITGTRVTSAGQDVYLGIPFASPRMLFPMKFCFCFDFGSLIYLFLTEINLLTSIQKQQSAI